MQQINNDKEIYSIVEYLKLNKIRCMKYNSALEVSSLRTPTFQSYLQLTEDGRNIVITNKKITEESKYILEIDPVEIERKKQEVLKSQKKMFSRLKPLRTDSEEEDSEEAEI